MGIDPMCCFSVEALKANIFAHATRVKGFMTFLANLTQVALPSDINVVTNCMAESERKWMPEYLQSLDSVVHGFIVSSQLVGKTFGDAAAFAYRESGGDVVLVTMKDTSIKNMYKVLDTSYILTFIMLYFIGSLCYLTWLDEIKGDVLQNFSSNSTAGVIARIASLDLVVLSYMINMIPCKVSLIELIFGKNEAHQESTSTQFYGITIVLNVLALLTSLMVSDLSLVLGINGAVCTNFVAFMLPTAFWLKVQSKPADPNLDAIAMFSPSNRKDVVVWILGAISMVFSSYQVMQRASGH